MASAFASAGYIGIVVEYRAQPSEILVDMRLLLDRDKIYRHDLAEVVLASHDPTTNLPYKRVVRVHIVTRGYEHNLWAKFAA